MKEVFVKYNPYKLETDITVEGIAVKPNSHLNKGEERLQAWLEDLPEILKDECNSTEFKITFHGTTLDYEDLLSVAKDARDKGITIACEHIPAKEVGDKEAAIDLLFAEIKAGPFEELRQPDVIKAFELAKSDKFEVNVIATMSAGKSTLINALLRQKLMPSKQEACTATITKINDSIFEAFRATAYDKDGNLLQTSPELSLEVMQQLNGDPLVSMINVEGDIPFVTPEEVTLVLVDTPGPNNSRDPQHRAATYRMLSESSKTLVLYVLNATQLGVEDDSNLLDHVSKIMSVGGKQSKDRFMFIVNKLDDFNPDEDSVEEAIEKVKNYLEDKGIHNPTIFPAAARPALDIRLMNKGQIADKRASLAIEFMVEKLNDVDMLHLENYAPLTPSVRGEVAANLANAREAGDRYGEALIHTGIIPIEFAIRMFVQKYSKTAKVKSIFDTFAKKLESAKSFENTKQEIATNQDKQREVLAQIDAINAKVKSGGDAKKFKGQIDAINYDKEIAAVSHSIIMEAQRKISSQMEGSSGKLTQRDAESICTVFRKFAENLQAKIQADLEGVVTAHMEKNAHALFAEYKNRVENLANELNSSNIEIKPFELMNGDISKIADLSKIISASSKTEKIKVDEEWVKNENKKWYKPWTWLEDNGHWRTIYGEKEYVDGDVLAQQFFASFEVALLSNGDEAVKYAKEQAIQIKLAFYKKFDELDNVLKGKLDELKACATDKDNVETIIKQTEERLSWLESIQNKAAKILEI